MIIQVSTDNHTRGSVERTQDVQALLEARLERFAGQITRAEVHLSDENGSGKTGGGDKRCLIEVRLAGLDPISVREHGDSYDAALRGAVDKMHSRIESVLGKRGRN